MNPKKNHLVICSIEDLCRLIAFRETWHYLEGRELDAKSAEKNREKNKERAARISKRSPLSVGELQSNLLACLDGGGKWFLDLRRGGRLTGGKQLT